MEQGFDGLPVVCESYEDRINSYVDGELAFHLQAELFTHLSRCEPCRRYLDGLIAFRRLVADEALVIPPSLDEAFLQRLGAHRQSVAAVKQRAARRGRIRDAVPVAGRAAVVMLVLGIIVGNIIANEISRAPSPGHVVAEEELVNFPAASSADSQSGAVYVFYPGLTVEAENWVETVATEPL